IRVGWKRSPSGGFKRVGRISAEGRSRVRLTYVNAAVMISAAARNDSSIPTLRRPLRLRDSSERNLASRRSRRARRMGRVDGMMISIKGNRGKMKEIMRWLSRAVLVGSYRNHPCKQILWLFIGPDTPLYGYSTSGFAFRLLNSISMRILKI